MANLRTAILQDPLILRTALHVPASGGTEAPIGDRIYCYVVSHNKMNGLSCWIKNQLWDEDLMKILICPFINLTFHN